MSRLRNFLMFQRAAWRALFRRRVRLVELPMAYEGPPHPSMQCRCYDGMPAGAHGDHRPGCPWVTAMCVPCGGTGWCEHCGGDGTAPNQGRGAMIFQRPCGCEVVAGLCCPHYIRSGCQDAACGVHDPPRTAWIYCGRCQRRGECPIPTCTNHASAPR